LSITQILGKKTIYGWALTIEAPSQTDKCKSVFTARFAQDAKSAKEDYFYGIVTTDPVKMLAGCKSKLLVI
jgi:hypothetical protein